MSDEVLYTVRGPKMLEDMSWEEVAEMLQLTQTIIVPVGSTEQHGPALPLAADTIQVVEMAKQTVARLAAGGSTSWQGLPSPLE